MKIITLFCSLILVLSACTHTSSGISAGCRDYYENSYLLSCDYQNAVIDAVIPAQSRIYNGLTEIKSPEDNSQQEWITVNNKKMVLVTTLIKEEVLMHLRLRLTAGSVFLPNGKNLRMSLLDLTIKQKESECCSCWECLVIQQIL